MFHTVSIACSNLSQVSIDNDSANLNHKLKMDGTWEKSKHTIDGDYKNKFNQIEDTILIEGKMEDMICVDDVSELVLQGKNGAQSIIGNTISISYVRCAGKPHCKLPHEIDLFIENHRMFFFYND